MLDLIKIAVAGWLLPVRSKAIDAVDESAFGFVLYVLYMMIRKKCHVKRII
ncbi:MAG TPA: hypothetical protein VI757_03915 [Bacteroidia bacterium]|nr:hypothetical protein [Bacteroidia bacterium]